MLRRNGPVIKPWSSTSAGIVYEKQAVVYSLDEDSPTRVAHAAYCSTVK